jgi:hypothetical protein
MKRFYQGKYNVKNKSKYIGDFKNVSYRSSWELKIFNYLDNNSNVLRWCSEEIVIPYISPIDNKQHRYFTDIYYETKISKYIIEIKPKNQTKPPIKSNKGKSPTKRYINEAVTYSINEAKWKAAIEYCEKHNIQFKIWTEDTMKQIGI